MWRVNFGLGALLVLLAVGMLGGCSVLSGEAAHEFNGTWIEAEQPAADFTLTSQDGQMTSLSDLRGKLVLLYFGYTYCPDVCPATLVEVKNALKTLGEQAGAVQVVMVTVDPERDTADKLAEYLANFNPSFIGLTGSLEQIRQITSQYGIYFGKQAGSAETNYLVEHNASLMVIDQQGYLKLIYPFGTTSAEIADDLSFLLR